MSDGIIPPVAPLAIAPNAQFTIVVPSVLNVTAETTLYTDTREVFLTDGGVD